MIRTTRIEVSTHLHPRAKGLHDVDLLAQVVLLD
jgi:hypothetical protein